MIPWITCREVVDFLDRYLAGGLEPDEVAKFERHLSECPPCVAYMHTYDEAARLGRAVLRPADEAPEDVPEDLVQAILRARSGGTS
jgi:anti-sigma factor RsiW